MRREDEESNEEVQVKHNKQKRAAAMVCQPTEEQPQWGGSVAGRSYKPRNKAMTHANLMNNYFNPNSVYTEKDFRRRFLMRRHVFEYLLRDVQQVNPYFRQKRDRAGRPGFSPHQKVTVALRMMAYGSPAYSMDETHGMSESTCLDTFQQFCDTIVQVYKDEYIRKPNQEDLNRLIHKTEDRGFSEHDRVIRLHVLGLKELSHWMAKRLQRKVEKAVASYDTWIWHAFFGVPGSQNYITVLGRSPLFNRLTEGKTPQLDYYINDRQYNMEYYLVDDIYPKWAKIVQAIPNPRNDAEKLFTLHQEAYQKDVERAFGILQARWKIISEPARGWSRENLDSIMMSCIILHNMIVEDERDEYIDGESDDDQEDSNRSRRACAKIYDGLTLPFNPRTGSISINEYMMCYRMIRSSAKQVPTT
ncbi:protein ALP1-like [Malus domestica]|uniref:protein ALP1-like n=1 Tax=Malus domestica TaxID=3750 RepID=UPI003975CCFA